VILKILEHSDGAKQINPLQYGFQKGKSCEIVLLLLQEYRDYLCERNSDMHVCYRVDDWTDTQTLQPWYQRQAAPNNKQHVPGSLQQSYLQRLLVRNVPNSAGNQTRKYLRAILLHQSTLMVCWTKGRRT